MPKGPALTIPVHIVRGFEPGPTLVAAAGEHGREVNGVASVDRICREIDPRQLTGTLIGVPAINPANINHCGFVEGEYGEHLWDSFVGWPGDVDGTPAERIAAALTREVMNDADAIINFHAWSWYSTSCAFTSPRNKQAMRLTRAFGLDFVCFDYTGYCKADETPLHPQHNMLTHYALGRGVPAMLVELRFQNWLSPESVDDGIRGIRNVMIAMGMLSGRVTRPAVQHEATEEELVHAPGEGMFIPVKALADTVHRGETLGYMLNLFTGKQTLVKSPCDGAVWLVSRVGKEIPAKPLDHVQPIAQRGDLLALIKHTPKAMKSS
ncbi:MAG: succinylglutamate desuccinylase/aspartoacylase family protein [Phycisphaeraceae bacterium]|nr:succinylglutamate desuccinylase/aspartoacylase family protein [Phycisphaeraceae bacterium]